MLNLALLSAAHIHTPNFIDRLNKRSGISVKYVWDSDNLRAQAAAQKLGATVQDLDTILSDSDITAVVVCSETNRHADLVVPAVEAGKHLFVEKPLGYAHDDALRMAQAIEAKGLIFQTGYFMRGQPIHQFLKAQVDKGHFGKITRVRHSNCHWGSLGGWFDTDWRWMADPKIAGCGGFGDLGTHSLDILLWLFGEVERVTADVNVITGRYGDCDESGEGLLKFKNGVLATLAAGWVDVSDPVTLQISGTEGHAAVVKGDLHFRSQHVDGANELTVWNDLPEAQPHAFELFLDALEGKPATLVGAKEAAYRNTVMGALYQAAQTQRWVTLD